ncbi:hypothetical protein ACPA9J_19010 [Pseudomonas aeruginosa]
MPAGEIEDVYPLTLMQEGLLLHTPAGTGHRHLLHAGPLPDRQPARSLSASSCRLAGGGGLATRRWRVVRLECRRNDVAG